MYSNRQRSTSFVVKQFVRIGGLKVYGGNSMSCKQEYQWFIREWMRQRELYTLVQARSRLRFFVLIQMTSTLQTENKDTLWGVKYSVSCVCLQLNEIVTIRVSPWRIGQRHGLYSRVLGFDSGFSYNFAFNTSFQKPS